MPILQGSKELQRKLRRLSKGVIGENSVTVGYTQNYALIVHENRNAKHKKGKVAGYLLDPANQKADQISKRITQVTAKTGSLEKGLLQGGLFLQRISQKVVPVDTGALKASAFTSKTSEVEKAAAAAQAKGDIKRSNELMRRAIKKANSRKKKKRRRRN